jgi:hypothetical protein
VKNKIKIAVAKKAENANSTSSRRIPDQRARLARSCSDAREVMITGGWFSGWVEYGKGAGEFKVRNMS